MKTSMLAFAAILFAAQAHAEAPKVVADIAPIHSLVSQVMEGVGEPYLLIPAQVSPHGYALKVSQVRELTRADLVFWVGESLTPWLEKTLDNTADQALTVELIEANGLTLFEFEKETDDDHHDEHDHGKDDHHDEDEHHAEDDHHDEDGHHDDKDDHAEDDHHDDDHDDHAHGDHEGIDPHIWLDPANAKVLVKAIAETLAQQDPENAALYRGNAKTADAKLDALISEVQSSTAEIKDKRYVVYHDAYRYFEARFDLGRAIPIADGHAAKPGAKRLSAVRKAAVKEDIHCIFSESQFGSRTIQSILRGMDAVEAELDPMGQSLEPGPALYNTLIQNLSTTFTRCLM